MMSMTAMTIETTKTVGDRDPLHLAVHNGKLYPQVVHCNISCMNRMNGNACEDHSPYPLWLKISERRSMQHCCLARWLFGPENFTGMAKMWQRSCTLPLPGLATITEGFKGCTTKLSANHMPPLLTAQLWTD